MVTRREALKMAAVGMLGLTKIVRAASASAACADKPSLTAFQTVDEKTDLADWSAYETEVHIGMMPDSDKQFLFGTAYRRKAFASDSLAKLATFRIEIEPQDQMDQVPQRKQGGAVSLTLFGHELESFGKETGFRHIGGRASLRVGTEGGKRHVLSLTPRGEATEIEPGCEAYAAAEQVVDALFRRGAHDIEANKIYVVMPPPPPTAGERFAKLFRRVLGL